MIEGRFLESCSLQYFGRPCDYGRSFGPVLWPLIAVLVCMFASGSPAIAAPGFSLGRLDVALRDAAIHEVQFLGKSGTLPSFGNGGGKGLKGLKGLKLGKKPSGGLPKFGKSRGGQGLKFGQGKRGHGLLSNSGKKTLNIGRRNNRGLKKFGNAFKRGKVGKGNRFKGLGNGSKIAGPTLSVPNGRKPGKLLGKVFKRGGNTRVINVGPNGTPPGQQGTLSGLRPGQLIGNVLKRGGNTRVINIGPNGTPPSRQGGGTFIDVGALPGGNVGGPGLCKRRYGCGPTVVPDSGGRVDGTAIATGVLGAVGALVGTLTHDNDGVRCPRGTMGRYPDCRPVDDGSVGSDTATYDPPRGAIPIPPIPVPPLGGGASESAGYSPPGGSRPSSKSGGPPANQPPVTQAAIPPLPPRPTNGAAPLPAAANEPDRRTDEVIVLVDGTSPETAEAVAQRYRLESLESERNTLIDATVQRFRIPDQRSVDAVLAEMQGDQRLAAVQPNYLYRLRDGGAAKGSPGMAAMQYALAKLRLPEAHVLSTGERTVLAVIDSAVDAAHPEFAGRIAADFDAVGSKEPGDTQKGPDAHGTAIAGIIAARGQLVGVAPSSTVVSARAFFREAGSEGPLTTTFILLRALDWAHGQNARIYNLSFAGPKDAAVSKAIAKVHATGGVLLAAAGNGGAEAPEAYPAAYSEVIAITATDATDRLYGAANRGGYVAIAAPGVDIIAPAPGGGYDYKSGTSFATAHVSGLVALMLERDPGMTSQDVRRMLAEAAVDLGPKGPDTSFGAGRADALSTIEALRSGLGRQAAR